MVRKDPPYALALRTSLISILVGGLCAGSCALIESAEDPPRGSSSARPDASAPSAEGCQSNEDCPAGRRCVSARCFEACAGDADCPEDRS
jgi:hypothetical protein